MIALALWMLFNPITNQTSQDSALVVPPFVRTWSQSVGFNITVMGFHSGVLYYRNNTSYGALEMKTGKLLWSVESKDRVSDGVVSQDALYLLAGDNKTDKVLKVDLETRHASTIATLKSQGARMLVSGNAIYVLDAAAVLSRYSTDTGSIAWSRKLASEPLARFGSMQMAVTTRGIYVEADKIGAVGVDPADGKVRWTHKVEYAGLYHIKPLDSDVLIALPHVARINIVTGDTVWKAGDNEESVELVGSTVVTVGRSGLIGRNLATGELKWKLPLRDAGSSYMGNETPTVSGGGRLWLDRRPLVCVSEDGKEIWNNSNDITGTPVYADDKIAVTMSSYRFIGYKSGSLPPLPSGAAEKRALAEELVANFEKLDTAERNRLPKLAPYSFKPLLARYVLWAKKENEKQAGDGMEDYENLQDAQQLLYTAATRSDSSAIVAALSQLGKSSGYRAALEKILQDKGDPQAFIPALIAQLRSLPIKDRGESATLSAISHSSHPQAVAFMIAALKDPKAAPDWRAAAFQHLAGVGGPAGIAAVRAARVKPAPVKPWYDRLDLKAIASSEYKVAIKKDQRGRTWMLFHSAVLGNFSDLFIVQKTGSGWGRPLFTGVWTSRTWDHEPPKYFHKIPMKKMLATEWIKVLPDDESIRKDSDGDGLTDLVEKRLGTDPHKADTDGDGVPDAIDPCPNGPVRALGDDEKIIAASLEARFFGEQWGVPALLEAPGIRPFKLYGYTPTIVWGADRKSSELGSVYSGGVNIISFRGVDPKKKTFITYGKDHKTAHTLISRYSGGLNGDGIEVNLIKVGNDWFVVDLQMKYVS